VKKSKREWGRNLSNKQKNALKKWRRKTDEI